MKKIGEENGICKIYTEKGNILTVFNLSEGLLDGKFKRFIPDTSYEGQVTQQEHLILNFKQGKLHGKCTEYDNIRGVYKFIENGDKVKITMRFRGREMAHQELGRELLLRVAEDTKEMGKVENMPKMEGRQMIMLIGPLPKS